ncbi:hypothetical protein ISS37_00025 [candidate division KSB1 bacterium]|nr:hypothetical protein [candidate division KSB1 bacterium]
MEQTKYIDKDEFVERGKRIYKRLKPKLERDFKGKVIAIEIESGDYVVGEDELDAAIKAKKKFPGKIFDFIRIGYEVVHKLRKGKE